MFHVATSASTVLSQTQMGSSTDTTWEESKQPVLAKSALSIQSRIARVVDVPALTGFTLTLALIRVKTAHKTVTSAVQQTFATNAT